MLNNYHLPKPKHQKTIYLKLVNYKNRFKHLTKDLTNQPHLKIPKVARVPLVKKITKILVI